MYLSLDEKRCTFGLFFYYFLWKPFQSVHRKNKFLEDLNKNPVRKISSTEFVVFGPAQPEHSFLENFYP